jgi:hypothetical protein
MGLGIPESMLISAAVGGVSSAATGKDPLLGAITGLAGAAVAPAVFGAAAAPVATEAAGQAAGQAATGSVFGSTLGSPLAVTDFMTGVPSTLGSATQDELLKNAVAQSMTGTAPASTGINSIIQNTGFSGSGLPSTGSQLLAGNTAPGVSSLPVSTGNVAIPPSVTSAPTATPKFLDDPAAYIKANKVPLIGASVAGATLSPAAYDPSIMSGPEDDPNNPLRRYRFDPNRYRPGARGYAVGGIAALAGGGMSGYDMMVGEMPMYARGGISDLGTYSDGGRMLKGPGDGMSDSIPGVIANKRPARLADGEFVVPADVVSHLGNGSTDAGAKQLYAMMNKVRQARTGTKKQGRQINPRRFMPA